METCPARNSGPHFAVAGLFLDALAHHDFKHLTAALERDATLSALLPGGFREWHGASDIAAVFERWFGAVEEFELLDATVGQIGALLQLRWRVRVVAARFGARGMVVEQHVYAATGRSGHIERMSLLCSGFWEEHADESARAHAEPNDLPTNTTTTKGMAT